MEHIRQAIQRAKEAGAAQPQPQDRSKAALPTHRRANAETAGADQIGAVVDLSDAHLEANRIIAHKFENPQSKPFDILRTQVLQSMDRNAWHVLGVTSPTPGCGKSVVAINLAISIARQPDRAVLLADLDLQNPQVANYLGLRSEQGLLSVLDGRTDLSSTLVQARVRNQHLLVLPCEGITHNSSERMMSSSMRATLQEIKADFKPWTVIVDLPPMLMSDDVISILPQLDCLLFVTAIGSTTIAEIKECDKYLDKTSVVQIVANKSTDKTHQYYFYSGYGKKNKRAPRDKASV